MKYIDENILEYESKINNYKNNGLGEERLIAELFSQDNKFNLYSVFLSAINHLKTELQTFNKIKFLGGRSSSTKDLLLKSIKLEINGCIFYLTIVDDCELVFSTIINNHLIPICCKKDNGYIETKYLSLTGDEINVRYYDLDDFIDNNNIKIKNESYRIDEILCSDIVDIDYFFYNVFSSYRGSDIGYKYVRYFDYETLERKSEIYNRLIMIGTNPLQYDIETLFKYYIDKYNDKIQISTSIPIKKPILPMRSVLLVRNQYNLD